MTRPVAAQFCATFLKPEMLHVYRQITGCREFRSVVFTQKRENAERFPFADVVMVPRARTRELRRWWLRSVRHRPVTIYRAEARRIEARLRQRSASVLHIYFGHIGVYLLPLLRRRALPTVVSFHGADAMVDQDKPAYRDALREVMSLADLLLVRSQSLADRLIGHGAAADNIRLHRTGIPMEQFPATIRQAPPDGAWHFVQACRLIEKKGLPTTLRAFAEFLGQHPRARLTIAGEGPDLEKTRHLAAELHLPVALPGFLDQESLRTLYASAHAFVHPSEVGRDGNQEGVPNSMLEAMATGLPVLATRHGGIPEAVTDGHSGYLVPERDAPALAAALSRLTADPARYLAMSQAAASTVREKFDQPAQIRVLETCYREAIERFPG